MNLGISPRSRWRVGATLALVFLAVARCKENTGPGNPPPAPSNLAANPTPGSATQIDLQWQDNATNEDAFRIERAPGGTASFTEIATVGPNATGYQSTGLTAGTSYSYRVRAFNAVGASAYSNPATATTLSAPAGPSHLVATPVSAAQINLTWTDNSGNEDGFRVERAPGGTTSFAEIAVVGPNVTSYQSTGLTEGASYSYRVRAYNEIGMSDYTTSAPATTLSRPAAPSDLVATAVSAAQINLTWTDNSGNEDGFRVERAPGGTTSFVEIATVGPNVTNYQNTGLMEGASYSYRVRAYNGIGMSDYTNPAPATTLSRPAAPTDLTATPTAGSGTQIDLRWQDNATTEEGFRIERCTGAGCTSFGEIATVGPNVTSYQNTGLTPGTSYSYRVRAYNAVGPSGYSNTAPATTLSAPAAPTALTATPTASSGTQIDLSWQDNATNEDGFRIERCTVAGCTAFTEIATVGPNLRAYGDAGLITGMSYSYRVRAYNAAGNSDYSNTAKASRTGDVNWDGCVDQRDLDRVLAAWGRTDRPPEDINQDGTVNAIDLSIMLSNWTAPGVTTEAATAVAGTTATLNGSGNLNGVATTAWFEWGTSATLESPAQTTPEPIGAGTTDVEVSAALSGLSPGTTYYYRVIAVNADGCLAKGQIVSFTTAPPLSAPTAPSWLMAVARPGSGTQIDLGWLDNATNEDGFRIERCTGAGCTSFGEIATVGPNVGPTNVTDYQNTGLAPGTSYSYRVRAYNAVGLSGYSNTATATTLSAPAAPTGLTATPTPGSGTQIDLSWQDNATNEGGFRIERCTGAGCVSFGEIATVGPNATSYQNTGLAPGTSYSYRVRAYNAVGPSGYSNTATATATNDFIAFFSNRSGGGDIYLYDAATSSLVPLPGLNTAAREVSPSLTPGARFIAFQRTVFGPEDVFLYDRSTSSLVPLPGLNSGFDDAAPSITPDGRLIAFTTARSGDANWEDVLLYDRSTSSLVSLPGLNTNGPSGFHEGSARISGDGRFIVFRSNRSGVMDIFLYDRSTSSLVPLPGLNDPAFRDYNPSISADARFIAFYSDRNGSLDIFLYDRSTTSLIALPGLNEPTFSDAHPSLSADARFIAFVSDRNGSADVFVYDRSMSSLVSLPGLNDPAAEDNYPAIAFSGATAVWGGLSFRAVTHRHLSHVRGHDRQHRVLLGLEWKWRAGQ